MSRRDKDGVAPSRRGFLTATAGLVTAAGSSLAVPRAFAGTQAMAAAVKFPPDTEPFHGTHQAGIVTPAQRYTYFAAFDLAADKRDDVVALLRAWTDAAARMAEAKTAQPLTDPLQVVATGSAPPAEGGDSYDTASPAAMVADTAEVLGLPAARLTLTFGFGAGMFVKDGKDRYGLASRRPAALVDMPKFVGDQLVEVHTGGDLSVQACADDSQVAFHAVRQLARIAGSAAKIRWVQTGFVPLRTNNETPRNLMGFKDGTVNPATNDPAAMRDVVWVDQEGPNWMQGGSYMVVRRIRIALEHWDRMQLAFQEQTVGRHKISGAPLGGTHETDALDLAAADKDGNPVIPQDAHVRLAAAATNGGAQILRRPYSYNDGVDLTAERWPPWRQGLEYDAGLFFICYQRDPRTGFIKIFERLANFDMMNQFVTHVGGGIFACPSGVDELGYIGQSLFEVA